MSQTNEKNAFIINGLKALHNLKHVVVLLTPEKAQELLSTNPVNNRKAKRLAILRYKNNMVNGTWGVGGDGSYIFLDEKGKLMDGQHRLMAIIESGVSVPMVLVYNVPAELFTLINIGDNRTNGDALTIAGVPNGARVASVLKFLLSMSKGTIGTAVNVGSSKLQDINAKIVLDFYNKTSDEIKGLMEEGFKISDDCFNAGMNVVRKDALVSYYILMSLSNKDKAIEFFEGYKTGENMSSDNPLLSLRTYMIKEKTAKKPNTRLVNLGMFVTAYNYFITERTVVLKGLISSYYKAQEKKFPELKDETGVSIQESLIDILNSATNTKTKKTLVSELV